jgi:hypothetical protein
MSRRDSSWPPDGPSYIRTEEFGQLLISIALDLQSRYSTMDFADAVALVFTWFDQKLENNRDFISRTRFPTPSAFRAYLRQAMWNAARVAERERKRHERLIALRIDRATEEPPTAEEVAILHEYVGRLPERHKAVFEGIFMNETEPHILAGLLGLSEDEIENVYEEAIDMLHKMIM